MSTSAQPRPSKPARLRRWLWKISRIVGLVYLGLCLVMYFLQNWMIFPGHRTQGERQAVVRPASTYELVHLTTADGEAIVAMFGPALDSANHPLADAAKRPTVLFFYGNAMCLADSFTEFSRFRRLGVNVLIPEYPGYGMSGGKPSERSLYACADSAYEHLLHRPDVDSRQIVAAGWSLGAAVATDLASRKTVMGLVTFSAFTSMRDEAHEFVPWLPTSLLLSYRFDNERKFATLTCPIFMAHGRQDPTAPFAMAGRLAAANGKVVPFAVESEHNDLFDCGGEPLMRALGEFIETHRGR